MGLGSGGLQFNLDSHALHAEGSEGNAVHGRNLIYINSDGHVGIGGIPSDEITDHLVVSGNAVLRQSIIDSTNYLNVNGEELE